MPNPPLTACEWRVGPSSIDEVRVVERGQRDGSVLYAVKVRSWVADHNACLELEPIPSSRDDDFIRRCRFDDWEEAMRVAIKVYEQEQSLRPATAFAPKRHPSPPANTRHDAPASPATEQSQGRPDA